MRIGTVCYSTRQGIGWIPKWYYDNGVITDVIIFHHSARKNHLEWYPPYTPVVAMRPFSRYPEVMDMLDKVDMMLFIETPFDWEILHYCKVRGVKTVIMPMYECTPKDRSYEPDLWLCPSLLDVEYFPGNPFVPVPVNMGTWKQRYRAKKFLHNGGNLGLRYHKGTLQILEALPYVQSPIELKITSQDAIGLDHIINLAGYSRKSPDPRVTFDVSEVPPDKIYDESYDVFIMAEKYNGLSLPPAEARAAGMLVVTSDRFPMNTWLPREPLIPVSKYIQASIGGSYLPYQEAVVDPKDIAATIDRLYDTDIQEYSLQGLEWSKTMSWDVLKPKIMEVLESV